MTYLAKIDNKDFNKWKKNNGKFNGRLQWQLWIDYLSDKTNFDEFLSTVTEDEMERTKDDQMIYKITYLNKKSWSLFLKNCRHHSMYGNDMVNILVKRFNKKGYCIETNIKV